MHWTANPSGPGVAQFPFFLVVPPNLQVSMRSDRRKLVPCSTVEYATDLLFADAAPLLEEEWNPGVPALVPDLTDPARIHRARPRSALTANDDPIDLVQADRADALEKWLDGKEPDSGVCPTELLDSRSPVSPILDADP